MKGTRLHIPQKLSMTEIYESIFIFIYMYVWRAFQNTVTLHCYPINETKL